MTEKLKVINLIAGPGAGKSTTAAGVFHELKTAGINAELVTEYAKDKVWDKHTAIFENQLYILAKQYHRLFRLQGQVDIVVTDSPLILSCYYNNGILSKGALGDAFNGLVHGLFDTFDNYNFFIKRVKAYNPAGRFQTEDEAKDIDDVLKQYLVDKGIFFTTVTGDKDGLDTIVREMTQVLNVERINNKE
jgi:hypothetical protein